MPTFNVGDEVVVERDETEYPSRGSWPRYRGRIGTVVVSENWGEIGVRFTKSHDESATWFKPYELRHN